jgi:hypothetical protein
LIEKSDGELLIKSGSDELLIDSGCDEFSMKNSDYILLMDSSND